MNANRKPNPPKKSANDIWQDFVKAELKSTSNLGKIFEKAGFGGHDEKTNTLTLYFPDKDLSKSARGQSDKLKSKLYQQGLLCDLIEFKEGEVPKVVQSPAPAKTIISSKIGNPLQALNINFPHFPTDDRGNELSKPILEKAVEAEKTCTSVYTRLNNRTRILAVSPDNLITVSFNWRLRVGGTRGFRELLLPVFHPIFGIPYIPSSSLKGAARAWARKHHEPMIYEILGMLNGDVAKAAKVEFLDAFPTDKCLSIDVATPQWNWQGDRVVYKPEPHPLLSMNQPQILIGLCPTARGTTSDVQIVKEWLENALKAGIGSRVSSGYGKALGQSASLPHSQTYNFELWTQGMYGCEPPQNRWKGQAEFRPTATRGILRYWFRAFAMSLYDASTCQTFEENLFGKLSQQGKTSISTLVNPSPGGDPYFYSGTILLEATEEKYLKLLEQLLILASNIGGIGRGSRRPLHLLDSRMRGCHWAVDSENLPFELDISEWDKFFKTLKNSFLQIQSSTKSHTGNLGIPKARQQDVLDKNAQVWLLKSPNQISPDRVSNWATNGNSPDVRGTALGLLYSDTKFKGKNQQGLGNENVGGGLETPSYVWIKSIFPRKGDPYQVITIFGIDNADRMAFAQFLKEAGAELVFGQMPTVSTLSSPSRPSPPKLRR